MARFYACAARAARRLFAPLARHVRNFVHCNRSIWRIAMAEMEDAS